MGGGGIGTGLALGAGSALLGHPMERTRQYEAAREAERQYDIQEESYTRYIKDLQNILNIEQAKAEDLSTQEAQEAQLRLGQSLSRAGITGGEGAQSIGGKGVIGIEEALQARLGEIEAAVQSQMAQARLQQGQALAPLEAQTEAAKQALRKSEVVIDPAVGINPQLGPLALLGTALGGTTTGLENLAPYFLPAAGTAAVGTAAGLPPEQVGRATQTVGAQQLLGQLGVNPQAFALPGGGLPREVGGQVYEPDSDIFGNVQYTASGAAPQPTVSPSTQLSQQKFAYQVQQDVLTHVEQYQWETVADRARFYNATVQAIQAGQPLPQPTDRFGKRKYRPRLKKRSNPTSIGR